MLSKKTKRLEIQIDDFLDKVMNGGLAFKKGIHYYFNNQVGLFDDSINQIETIERTADDLRRSIETQLYMHTLIPESRGDVLGILESSDKVLNLIKEALLQYSVEKPVFLESFKDLFMELTELSVSAVETMVGAVRAYFNDLSNVRNYVNKTIFMEKESDKVADKLKRVIFDSPEIDLSRKMHTRYFAHRIEKIADAAEDVCDRLSIAVIKRHG